MTNPYPDLTPSHTLPAAGEPGRTEDAPVQPLWVTGPGSGLPPLEAPERRGLGPALLIAVIVAGFGLLIGWIWAEVAPRVAVIKTASGFVYADPEPEQAVAADGWFAILGGAAGLGFAILAWALLPRHRGVAVMVGLTVGSLVAACVAWWVGYKIGLAAFERVRDSAAVGVRLDAPLGLRMTDLDEHRWWPPRPTGVAAVQALVVAFVYTALAGFSTSSNLRRPGPRPPTAWAGPDQFGPSFADSSDTNTGTART